MSSPAEDTEETMPCVVITSCDNGFKEEDLIKREFAALLHAIATMLTWHKANVHVVE